MNYGIRVKNPLPHPVRVEVIDGQTILQQVIVHPGTSVLIPLEKPGNYDVRTTIMGAPPHPGGVTQVELGSADWKAIDHQDVKPAKVEPLMLDNRITLKDKHWRTVVHCLVSRGTLFSVRAVEITVQPWLKWRIRLDGKITPIEHNTTFENLNLTGGQSISLQAKNTVVVSEQTQGRISGELTTLEGIGETNRAPDSQIEEPEEEEEQPIRSLADMFEDMQKKEVPV